MELFSSLIQSTISAISPSPKEEEFKVLEESRQDAIHMREIDPENISKVFERRKPPHALVVPINGLTFDQCEMLSRVLGTFEITELRVFWKYFLSFLLGNHILFTHSQSINEDLSLKFFSALCETNNLFKLILCVE